MANKTNKTNKFLYNIKRKHSLEKEVYERIRLISALIPTLYSFIVFRKKLVDILTFYFKYYTFLMLSRIF